MAGRTPLPRLLAQLGDCHRRGADVGSGCLVDHVQGSVRPAADIAAADMALHPGLVKGRKESPYFLPFFPIFAILAIFLILLRKRPSPPASMSSGVC